MAIENISGYISPVLKTSGIISFNEGEIIRAEILDSPKNGEVLIRLKGVMVKATVEAPRLQKGEVLLKVTGKGDAIKLRLQDDIVKHETPVINNRNRFFELLSKLPEAKIKMMDFQRLIENLTKQLQPFRIETKALNDFKIRISDMNWLDLKKSLEKTGVLFETVFKNSLHEKTKITELIKRDIKGTLLKIKATLDGETKLHEQKIINLTDTLEKIINHIEYYQLDSKAYREIHFYLPLLWDGLVHSEMHFKQSKNTQGAESVHSCLLKLEFKDIGSISILIFSEKNDFMINLWSENDKFRKLIDENRDLLHKMFEKSNLSLKEFTITNINEKLYKNDIDIEV